MSVELKNHVFGNFLEFVCDGNLSAHPGYRIPNLTAADLLILDNKLADNSVMPAVLFKQNDDKIFEIIRIVKLAGDVLFQRNTAGTGVKYFTSGDRLSVNLTAGTLNSIVTDLVDLDGRNISAQAQLDTLSLSVDDLIDNILVNQNSDILVNQYKNVLSK